MRRNGEEGIIRFGGGLNINIGEYESGMGASLLAVCVPEIPDCRDRANDSTRGGISMISA